MSVHIEGANVSHAWLNAVQYLLAQPGRECSNLTVSITNPTAEVAGVRRELDAFADAENLRGQAIPAIHSVAGTIFPSSLYRPLAADPAEHLFEMERLIRPVIRKHRKNRRGTYFERLVAYPLGADAEVNQLAQVLKKLRHAASRGHRNGNMFELATFHPGRDTNLRAFPCLSHISVTLQNGRLDAAAVYRNHYFLERAYGNYLGLGEILRFLATESGFDVGELLCVSSHAYLEVQEHGRARVEQLTERCAALVVAGSP